MQRLLAALRNWFRAWLGNSAEASPVMNLVTFRDHFSSLFQSAATDLARSKLAPGAATPGMEDPHIDAATRIASLWNDRQPIPAAAPAGIAQNVWDCSKQGFQLMQAAAAGNTAQVAVLQQANAFSSCDPNWVKDILNYVTFLAKNGMRDAIPYIRAAKISPVPISLPSPVADKAVKVGIIGDWGTGTQTAINLLEQQSRHVFRRRGLLWLAAKPEPAADKADREFFLPARPGQYLASHRHGYRAA
jgi:hypothetical protein